MCISTFRWELYVTHLVFGLGLVCVMMRFAVGEYSCLTVLCWKVNSRNVWFVSVGTEVRLGINFFFYLPALFCASHMLLNKASIYIILHICPCWQILIIHVTECICIYLIKCIKDKKNNNRDDYPHAELMELREWSFSELQKL